MKQLHGSISEVQHAPLSESKQANHAFSTPTIAILLCTYFGERFLSEQLDSYLTQSHDNWELWVPDDGSDDQTRTILKHYSQKNPNRNIQVIDGPSQGFVRNFMSLASNSAIKADYYAWSDQDDIWAPDKLERAASWLSTQPQDIPALYCSRTTLVDAANQEIGCTPLYNKKPCFRNALMQNIGGGNTMVFNHAAKLLLQQTPAELTLVSHDWWAYLLVSASGGSVYYDENPSLNYRQHAGNLVGGNTSWAARTKRIRLLFQGRFYEWNSLNISALQAMSDHITPANRHVLNQFIRARQASLPIRLIALKKAGIYRQTLFGNLGLVAAAIFNKI